MVEEAETVAANEARAAGIHWTFAPMVDIARDARWGRMVEGAGEDPYLGAAMARAQVQGFQGRRQLGAPNRVLACVKHFAGYGAADGGRDYDSSYKPDRTYRAIHAGAAGLHRPCRRVAQGPMEAPFGQGVARLEDLRHGLRVRGFLGPGVPVHGGTVA